MLIDVNQSYYFINLVRNDFFININ